MTRVESWLTQALGRSRVPMQQVGRPWTCVPHQLDLTGRAHSVDDLRRPLPHSQSHVWGLLLVPTPLFNLRWNIYG